MPGLLVLVVDDVAIIELLEMAVQPN